MITIKMKVSENEKLFNFYMKAITNSFTKDDIYKYSLFAKNQYIECGRGALLVQFNSLDDVRKIKEDTTFDAAYVPAIHVEEFGNTRYTTMINYMMNPDIEFMLIYACPNPDTDDTDDELSSAFLIKFAETI